MHRLSSVILFFCWVALLPGQTPHGDSFKMDCAACHSPDGWEIPASSWIRGELVVPEDLADNQGAKQHFSHQQTEFPLSGQHLSVDCIDCHQALVFQATPSSCNTCHVDIHQMTVGDDCRRCHTPDNWLVDQVTDLHIENGFPLLGVHAIVGCNECHTSETAVRFDRIGNDCINCHLDDYQATTSPDHASAGYSTDCIICHDPASPEWFWTAGAANHQFFPLTGGHDIQDCTRCHTTDNYADTPSDCFACHQQDYQSAANPDHVAGNFPTDCALCHSTKPGWEATDFSQHDQNWFPIYSGTHKGEWNQCTDCHTNPGIFTSFSCIDCHEHNDAGRLANKHDEVSDYSFNSQACYSCHPKGHE